MLEPRELALIALGRELPGRQIDADVLETFDAALRAGVESEEILCALSHCEETWDRLRGGYAQALTHACARAGRPAPLPRCRVEMSDHVTAVVDEGVGDRPVVILHSLGLDSRMADWIVPPLATRVRVIAYDLRLHGQTTRAPVPSFTLERCARDLADLLDGFGVDQAHVVGFSMGGAIAQLFALENRARVASLALVCTMSQAPRSIYIGRAESAEAEGMEGQVSTTLARWFNIGELARNTAAVRYARMKVRSASIEHWRQYWYALAGIDTTRHLGELGSVPTSVIAAELDKSTSVGSMREIAQRIPHSHFAVIPGGPHMVSLECPTQTADAVLSHIARTGDVVG